MAFLPIERLKHFQSQTFRTAPGRRLTSPEEAIAYANERGFIYFWPITDVHLPSLWVAAAGDRPVADEHDDPGHVTWGWKDSLLGKRAWYYAKVLRKKATIISLDVLPHFYALSENYGSPEEDYLTLYHQGRMTAEARFVYEALLEKGPLDTIALRQAARLSSMESEARFNKAITDLQADFKVLPVGVAQAGAWRYAFVYDLVHRHYPDLIDRTRFVSETQARSTLVERYFRSLGAAQARDVVKLFGWKPAEVEQAIDRLAQAGALRRAVEVEGRQGQWMALADLLA
jgi:hypothetical protein